MVDCPTKYDPEKGKIDSIPVWVLEQPLWATRQTTTMQPLEIVRTPVNGKLKCLTTEDVGRRIQKEQCYDYEGRLMFNFDGRLVCS